MLIEIYADIVCPFCYLGEKRLRDTLRERPDLYTELWWRPFQLRPEMPAEGLPWREFAREKFGGERQARMAFSRVTAAGAEEGLTFDFGRVASAPNTVNAHRLVLHAEGHGHGQRLIDALFRAYFAEGRDIGTTEELADVATAAGMEPGEAGELLAGEEYTDGVWAAQEEAAERGVQSVPFYVFDGRYAVSGAQPAEVFLRTLDATLEAQAS